MRTIRYCPQCGEILNRHHTHCKTPDEILAGRLDATSDKPVGGAYCPDDASEKVYRRAAAERTDQDEYEYREAED